MKALYMTNSYLKEFSAVVKQIESNNILLDETAFYPQGGGQPCDFGSMSADGKSYSVVNVFKKDGAIWHEVSGPGLKEGDRVDCRIDWERRYRLMRMHTAAHVINSIFYKEASALITGNQLGIDKSRIDFSLDVIDREKIQAYIEKANHIVQEALGVKIYFLKKDEAMKIEGIVKLAAAMPPDVEELRIVEIPGVDLQADGGTQVENTKEIGKIVLLSLENKGKNNRRMYYTLEES